MNKHNMKLKVVCISALNLTVITYIEALDFIISDCTLVLQKTIWP